MEINKEVLKGHIDTLLLSALSTSDMYGYELAKSIRTRSNEEFEVKEGTMYLALKRLEKNGFIEGYYVDDETTGGGRRKYFRLLEAGKSELSLRKEEWSFMKRILSEFLEGGI